MIQLHAYVHVALANHNWAEILEILFAIFAYSWCLKLGHGLLTLNEMVDDI